MRFKNKPFLLTVFVLMLLATGCARQAVVPTTVVNPGLDIQKKASEKIRVLTADCSRPYSSYRVSFDNGPAITVLPDKEKFRKGNLLVSLLTNNRGLVFQVQRLNDKNKVISTTKYTLGTGFCSGSVDVNGHHLSVWPAVKADSSVADWIPKGVQVGIGPDGKRRFFYPSGWTETQKLLAWRQIIEHLPQKRGLSSVASVGKVFGYSNQKNANTENSSRLWGSSRQNFRNAAYLKWSGKDYLVRVFRLPRTLVSGVVKCVAPADKKTLQLVMPHQKPEKVFGVNKGQIFVYRGHSYLLLPQSGRLGMVAVCGGSPSLFLLPKSRGDFILEDGTVFDIVPLIHRTPFLRVGVSAKGRSKNR